MSNQRQAAQVIYDEVNQTWERGEILTTAGEAERLANALADAGLLAPDTPQPFFEHRHGPNWEIPINDQGGGVATVRTLGGDVYIERPGHGHGHGFITSPAEAKQLAAAILAAAQYSEQEQA